MTSCPTVHLTMHLMRLVYSLRNTTCTCTVYECVHACVCVFVVCCLATQIISLSTSDLGDCKVARVGRPATDYKLVVRPWESGI